MNVRRTRQLLWLATTAFTAGAVTIAALGLSRPVSTPIGAVPLTASIAAAGADGAAFQSLDPRKVEQVARLRLQRPLFDPPPVEKAPPPPPPPPKLPVRLIGVALEPAPGRSVGIFAVGGNIEFKGVGDAIDVPSGPATVQTIDAASATVDFAGRTITLELESAEGKR